MSTLDEVIKLSFPPCFMKQETVKKQMQRPYFHSNSLDYTKLYSFSNLVDLICFLFSTSFKFIIVICSLVTF